MTVSMGSGGSYVGLSWKDSSESSIHNVINTSACTLYAPLKSSLILSKGAGDPTYTQATAAWEFDNEGKLILVPSGSARFGGARMVYNQIAAPTQDFTSATWGKSGGGGVTVSGDAITAPDGTLTADKIIPNAGTAQHYIAVSNRGTWPIGSVIVNSIYAKYAGLQYLCIYQVSAPSAGAVWFDLINGTVGASRNGAVGTIESVGDGWYRCKFTGTASSIATSIEYHLCTTDNNFNGVGDGVNGAYLWGPQLENVTGQADQTASEYVSVGVLSAPYHGAGVDGVKWFVTNKDGSAIPASSLLGNHTEGARTNSLLWARDLTNAAWAKTNITAAKTATGIDNAANSASTLTATAADAIILQPITLASEARCASAYVKRRTGTGTISFTQDGGSTWTDITSQINSSTWSRVQITSTLANPSVGFKISTSGDEIDVDCVQNEAGAVATSPIVTTTATVTRNADSLTYQTASNWSDTAGTAYIEVQPLSWVAGGAIGSATNGLLLSAANSGATASDGTNTANGPAGSPSGREKLAMRWGGGAMTVASGGVVGTAGTYDGGMGLASVGIAVNSSVYCGRVAIYDYAMTDAELQAITA